MDKWVYPVRERMSNGVNGKFQIRESEMQVLKYCVFAVGVLFFVAGCKDKSDPSKGESMAKVLKITWQRLVDEKGQTCQRCGSTETELRKAFQSLKKSLAPLGIRVAIKKKALDPATCARDISQSNRIWVGKRTLEEWLDAKVGRSSCGFCCAELGDQVECRTLEVEGQVYETIPADLIIKAGLLAAAGLYDESSAKSCCPGDSLVVKTDIPSCCPISSKKPKSEGDKSCIKNNTGTTQVK